MTLRCKILTDLPTQVPDLQTEVADPTTEVPDLGSGGIQPHLTPVSIVSPAVAAALVCFCVRCGLLLQIKIKLLMHCGLV